MRKVVGLIGLRGAGKDTVAHFLVSESGWKRAAFGDALYREVAQAFGVTVEFLGNRETKELPQPELALVNCVDDRFVALLLRLDAADSGLNQPRGLGHAFRGVARLLGLEAAYLGFSGLRRPRSPRQVLQYWGTEYRRQMVRDDYWREQVRKHLLVNPDDNFVITDVRFPDEAAMVTELGGALARVVRPDQAGSNDPALLHSSEQAMLNYKVPTVFINAEGPQGLTKLKSAVLTEYEPQTLKLAA